jgi:hypothetical protein
MSDLGGIGLEDVTKRRIVGAPDRTTIDAADDRDPVRSVSPPVSATRPGAADELDGDDARGVRRAALRQVRDHLCSFRAR